MGWIHQKPKLSEKDNTIQPGPKQIELKSHHEPSIQIIEDVSSPRIHKPLPITTTDWDLPFIPPSLLVLAQESNLLWLVIDNIVYDCTSFADEHPAGAEILQPFRGSDCSWQFWRFHGRQQLVDFGKPLRIGVTKGVKNRFEEQPRFVGLRKIWDMDD